MTERSKWLKASIMAAVIVFLDVLVLHLGISKISVPYIGTFQITWSVSGIGVITFFGTLMLANYLSGSADLNKGEIRKAITASFIAVYFVLVSLFSFSEFNPSNLAETIIGHFTYLVGIIVVFYFGSSTVRDLKGK